LVEKNSDIQEQKSKNEALEREIVEAEKAHFQKT
jgi:hypothetical protein